MRLNKRTTSFLIISLCSRGYAYAHESNGRHSIRGTATASSSSSSHSHTHSHTQHKIEQEHYDLSSSSSSSSSTSSSAAGPFDFYVLSMSYQPEFCFQHRHESFYGCENPMDFWRKSLTLHGLWPERNDGSWPATCTNEKFNTTTVKEIGTTRFNTYWPNVKASSPSSLYYSFWDHEWTKHGTCSGLGQVEYFNNTLNHFLETPSIVGENYGGSVTKGELLAAYSAGHGGDGDGYDVVLVCSGGRFLSEVRTCIGKNFDGSATKGIGCIPEVEREGNCGEVIKISKFYIDGDDDDDESSSSSSVVENGEGIDVEDGGQMEVELGVDITNENNNGLLEQFSTTSSS